MSSWIGSRSRQLSGPCVTCCGLILWRILATRKPRNTSATTQCEAAPTSTGDLFLLLLLLLCSPPALWIIWENNHTAFKCKCIKEGLLSCVISWKPCDCRSQDKKMVMTCIRGQHPKLSELMRSNLIFQENCWSTGWNLTVTQKPHDWTIFNIKNGC